MGTPPLLVADHDLVALLVEAVCSCHLARLLLELSDQEHRPIYHVEWDSSLPDPIALSAFEETSIQRSSVKESFVAT